MTSAAPRSLPGTLAPALAEAARERLDEMLGDIRRLIELETPSSDLAAVTAGAADVAALIRERLGASPETILVDGVPHLRLRFGSGRPRVVLLNHQDTVWPVGTLKRLPFSAEDGVLRGPGVFDMLTGLVMSIHALALLREIGASLDGVSMLVTGDEEIGSITSRRLILDEAEDAEAVFVQEAAADGALKLARKGTSIYTVEVLGKAAHAGLEPEAGINAGLALGLLLPEIAGLGDPDLGTTVTPTALSGGTTTNTVPEQARVDVDVRAVTKAEQKRVDEGMCALRSAVPGARVVIHGGLNRPPMERAAAQALYERAIAVAGRLGVARPEGVEVGGASDGNFTADAGVPTLDGLGAAGAGAHAEHEHALIGEIPPRTALLAGLIGSVLADSP